MVTATPREVAFYREAVLRALPVAHLTIEIHRCELPHADGGGPAHDHPHGHPH